MPIFLSNPLLVGWKNYNSSLTHQNLNPKDLLQSLAVSTLQVRRVVWVGIKNVLLKKFIINYNLLLNNIKI